MGFNLARAFGGAVKGLVTGGPLGAARGALSGFGGSRRPTVIQTPDSVVSSRLRLPFFEQSRTTQYFAPSQGISNYPVTDGGGMAGGAVAAAGCPTGFRLNKSTYVTRGGGTSRWGTGLQLHPKNSTCVRRRKLNAGNGRAALHAVRRLVSFYRLSNRVAKQLRRAATRAHIRGARRGRALPAGRGVEVVNVE